MARYSDEFKREALNLAAQPGMRVAQVEQDLGITPGLIYKWRQRYRVDENSNALKPSAERDLEADNRRLKHDLVIARPERDILKKPWPSSRGRKSSDLSLHRRAARRVQHRDDVPRAGSQPPRLLRLAQTLAWQAPAGE